MYEMKNPILETFNFMKKFLGAHLPMQFRLIKNVVAKGVTQQKIHFEYN